MKISNREKESKSMPYSNKIGIFLASLLVTASAIYLYSPVIGSHADTTQQADINLNVAPGIGIRVSSANVNLNATVGSFVHDSVNVDVATNSQYGYTLTLEDKDDSSSMTATGISDVVSSNFSGKKTSSQMADNTWGFSLDDSGYYKVPVNGSPVAIKRTFNAMTTDYETTPVDFGAKVGMNLTAGTYSDIVVFTAYVNGQDKKPSDGTDPLNPDGSEFSYDPCLDAPYVSNGILTDPRDGTEYTVKGLKDGQCWMTQNMRLLDTTIDSTNSDLPDGMSYTVPPSNGTSNEYDTSIASTAIWTMNTYLDFGVLYNYYTATASTGGTAVSSGKAPGSICPKGWRMPMSLGDQNEYDRLVTLYGNDAANLSEKRGGEANLTYHGIMYYGGWTEISTMGGYWTSNILSSEMAEFFNFYKEPAYGVRSRGKALNLAVRCIAK